jgi:hypothetical protein
MAPMARKEHKDTYHVKQIEYLVRYNDNLTIGQKVLKYEVITKAMSLNLDQAAIDNFFAQPEVQDKIRDKQWYTRRVMASNISTTTNLPPPITHQSSITLPRTRKMVKRNMRRKKTTRKMYLHLQPTY